MLRNWTLVILVPIIISGVFTFALTDQLAIRPVFATSKVEQVIGTSVTLKVSESVILVGENFTVSGVLKQKQGMAMGGRNVTVSWATNRSIILYTSWDGSFAANISFPLGFRQGLTNITANFIGDIEYIPSSSYLTVKVVYRPSMITAEILPAMATPLDQVNVTGRLLGIGNQSLPNRTITIKLDETVLGNATTNSSGAFAFSFIVPGTIGNGTHSLGVFFNPTYDIFAPCNTTSSLSIEPQTTPATAAITTPQTTPATAAITTPSWESAAVFVLIAVVIGGSLFSLAFKRKRGAPPTARAVQEPAPKNPPPTPLGSVSETERVEFPPMISQYELVSRINLEKDHAAKIAQAYYLAQDLITQRLGLAPEKNETHLEYFDRVTKNAPYIKEPLREIVQLFELTRFTTNPCDAAQSSQAALALLMLFKEIESRATHTHGATSLEQLTDIEK